MEATAERSDSTAAARKLREDGNAHTKAGRHAEGRAAYDHALEALSGARSDGAGVAELRAALLSNRALCSLELRDARAAAADCDAVLEAQPANAKARYRRALAREMQCRYDEAIADLESAADALQHIDSDLQAALRRIRKQRQRAPSARAEALAAEAERASREGEHLRAVELLTRAIELAPQDAALYEARARECGSLEKYAAVVHDAERIIELRPELASGHVYAGMALYCMHEYEQATHAYARAAALEPSDASIREARDDAAKKLGASLRKAAMAGDTALLGRYTRNRIADFDARDENGFTPLTLAVVGGHGEAAELLLRAGLPVDATDRFGKTALHWAASRGLPELGARLLDAGSAPDARDGGGWTPLMAASHAGCCALVEALLARAGGALNARPQRSVPTPLMCAAQNGHARAVELLLSAGADAGARLEPKGQTALDFAVQGKHEEAAALLRPATPLETFEQGL